MVQRNRFNGDAIARLKRVARPEIMISESCPEFRGVDREIRGADQTRHHGAGGVGGPDMPRPKVQRAAGHIERSKERQTLDMIEMTMAEKQIDARCRAAA